MERTPLAGVLVGTVLALWPAHAAAAPVARSSAEQLLWTRLVRAGGPAVQSSVSLVRGRRYRIVASGSFTESGTINTIAQGPFSYTQTYDALYCYVGPKFPDLAGPGCTAKPETTTNWRLKIGAGPERFLYQLGESGNAPPPYDRDTHTYEQRFTANASGKLTIIPAVSSVRPTYSGSLTYKLYGEPAPATPRTGTCTAPRDLRAAASANCKWEVSFRLRERGFPTSGLYVPTLVGMDMSGEGKIVFNRQPRRGALSWGSLAAVAVVETTYLRPPFISTEHQIRLHPYPGSLAVYEDRGGQRAVRVVLAVIASNDPNCSIHGVATLTLVDFDDAELGGTLHYTGHPRRAPCLDDGKPPAVLFTGRGRNRVYTTISKPRLVQ